MVGELVHLLFNIGGKMKVFNRAASLRGGMQTIPEEKVGADESKGVEFIAAAGAASGLVCDPEWDRRGEDFSPGMPKEGPISPKGTNTSLVQDINHSSPLIGVLSKINSNKILDEVKKYLAMSKWHISQVASPKESKITTAGLIENYINPIQHCLDLADKFLKEGKSNLATKIVGKVFDFVKELKFEGIAEIKGKVYLLFADISIFRDQPKDVMQCYKLALGIYSSLGDEEKVIFIRSKMKSLDDEPIARMVSREVVPAAVLRARSFVPIGRSAPAPRNKIVVPFSWADAEKDRGVERFSPISWAHREGIRTNPDAGVGAANGSLV